MHVTTAFSIETLVIVIFNIGRSTSSYQTAEFCEEKLYILGEHLTDPAKSCILQVDDSGEEILHEMGKRKNCAIVELNGIVIIHPLLHETNSLK